VIVWAEPGRAAACAHELRHALQDVDVLPLAAASTGARATTTG
jgi:hypothetical protein